MSQAALTATIAIAIAVVLTAATAAANTAARTSSRAIKLVVVGTVVAIVLIGGQRAKLRINFTSSMPMGIYVLSPLPPGVVKRGMLVAVCAPARAAAIGLRRGYLGRGPCADGTELLLKSVAAIGADWLDVTASGLVVNGCQLPHSRPVSRDRSRRDLEGWPRGRYRLAPDRVWLYAADDRSWDSRYWGPVSATEIDSRAVALLVLPAAFQSATTAGRRCITTI